MEQQVLVISLKVRSTSSFYLHLPKLWSDYYRIYRNHYVPLRAAANALRLIASTSQVRRSVRRKHA